MFKASATLSRADAERLSDILAGMDPSPSSAVSVEEVSKTSWSLDAYCLDEDRAKQAADIITRELPGARVAVVKLADKDWVAESLAGLPPVEAGPFVVAGAHALARKAPGKKSVWIEAGPAFGTGHHGTTKGCLEALALVMRTRRLGKVLDIGTGSAVLAIAALKAGATSAIGTDIDKESVRIAGENRRNNRVGRRLQLIHATGANHTAIREGAPYDLIFANILARPLVGLAPEIARLLKPGGVCILSGLLSFQEPQVKAAYEGRGLKRTLRLRRTGWSTLVYRRPIRAD
jgi:ribosomal protein L11 methyltransferase